MAGIEITDEYLTIKVEYAEMDFEARWRGGHYVNYFASGKEFACAWQDGDVRDAETFRDFVLENMPFHMGIEDEDAEEEDSA